MSDIDDLTAEIRKHIAQQMTVTPVGPHIATGYWWYDGSQDGQLPEALAVDLIKAGWVKWHPADSGAIGPDPDLPRTRPRRAPIRPRSK